MAWAGYHKSESLGMEPQYINQSPILPQEESLLHRQPPPLQNNLSPPYSYTSSTSFQEDHVVASPVWASGPHDPTPTNSVNGSGLRPPHSNELTGINPSSYPCGFHQPTSTGALLGASHINTFPVTDLTPHQPGSCADPAWDANRLYNTASPRSSADRYECKWDGCRYTGTFGREAELMRHIKKIHVCPGSSKCPVEGCKKAFNRGDNLQEHLLRRHRYNPPK